MPLQASLTPSQPAALIVGLTGGIGSGKTAASDLFAGLGVEIIDADVIARAALEPGSPLLDDVYEHFGSHLELSNGQLNRAALRELVFNQPEEKRWLEELVHPWVREEVIKKLQAATGDYLILSSPLLIESHQDQWVDRILVIDLPEPLQIERTCSRDNNQQELVRKIMANQLSREARLSKADDVIDNSRGLNELKKQVEYWHAFYQQLARRN